MKILKTLLLSVVLLLFVPLVQSSFTKAQNFTVPPIAKSDNVNYEIDVNSDINVTEVISFNQASTGEFTRVIPKYLNNVPVPENMKSDREHSKINVGISDLKLTASGIDNFKYDETETSNDINVTFDVSELTPSKREVTLTYKMKRAINEITNQDSQATRNNIELFGLLLPFSNAGSTVDSVIVKVTSSYATFGGVECYGGNIQSGQRRCLSEFDKNEARAYSTASVGSGEGFLVSFTIFKGGSVKTAGGVSRFFSTVLDYLRVNWLRVLIILVVVAIILYLVKKIFYIKRVTNEQ